MKTLTQYIKEREELFRVTFAIHPYEESSNYFCFGNFLKINAFNKETYTEILRMVRGDIENMPHSAFSLVSNDNRRAYDECRTDILNDLQVLEDELTSNA